MAVLPAGDVHLVRAHLVEEHLDVLALVEHLGHGLQDVVIAVLTSADEEPDDALVLVERPAPVLEVAEADRLRGESTVRISLKALYTPPPRVVLQSRY